MLEIDRVCCAYGRVEVLHSVCLTVEQGEIVTLLGANGAGKTTLLRAISGICPLTGGEIRFEGERLDLVPPHRRVERGIAQVPEGRQIFTALSVEDNLRLGAWRRSDGAAIARDLARVFALFPVLAERRASVAGGLSGGQQQMLAIGRALMGSPRLLLLDEPSMGLAPLLIDQVMATIVELKRSGLTILLVEQNVSAALSIADRGYVLETGSIEIAGRASDLLTDPEVASSYLGM
ncbi:ABC transporter ATP-binding protein [Xanthobacter tagetidis]|uniref:ABC transporter ATP-binding protein n=1 Tax=Xanthobacter tagetidis TaxID=60216 RepID=A0A3L7A3Z4_9HYPH|nr:ABC transporter ATP-binding protein [Xanthobacter tagetidis]MBB6307161.1 branched-chain amino acid transport system ATP-binding protein [Xanthobacter tagetidis]RLP74002.1 ABC transporter ATP-binding protein [Xanthobacter tagetidis]